jgi:uncharacterized OB-fold protein
MSTSKEDNGKNAAPPALRMRPVLGHDNKWWWDRINEGELPIQRCKQCGDLHHPPRPGKGTVYSYVVLYRPEFPGYEYPLVAALIDLEEGTRIASNIVGIEPADVEVGMAVKLSIENVDDELKLPLFRPAS